MNSKERIKTIFNFGVPDRVGVFDAPWPETVSRWRREGLPEGIHVNEYFDFDVDTCLLLDTSFLLEEKVLEVNEKYIIFSNRFGVVNKVIRNQTGAPLVIDYLIKTKDDWLKYKPLLRPSKDRTKVFHWGEYELLSEDNIISRNEPWSEKIKKYQFARKKNKFIFFVSNGPFETVRNFHNVEELYLKLVEDKEVVFDMFNTITDLIIKSFDELKEEGIIVDGFHFADDIAYKNGMIFSPGIYKELLFPCHKRLCEFFKSQRLPIMFHTDGRLDEVLPLLIESGITAIQPIEAKVGNDVCNLKRKYGDRLVFVGNIDIVKMAGTKQEIEEEIHRKVEGAMKAGGYIYHSDHSVPPTVSFENYKYVIDMVRKYGKY